MKVGDRVEERSGMEVGAGVLVGRQVLISLSLSSLFGFCFKNSCCLRLERRLSG